MSRLSEIDAGVDPTDIHSPIPRPNYFGYIVAGLAIIIAAGLGCWLSASAIWPSKSSPTIIPTKSLPIPLVAGVASPSTTLSPTLSPPATMAARKQLDNLSTSTATIAAASQTPLVITVIKVNSQTKLVYVTVVTTKTVKELIYVTVTVPVTRQVFVTVVVTATYSPTPIPSPTPTASETATPSPTPTASETATPSPTVTASETATPSPTVTQTEISTATEGTIEP